jgi:hypothetical protein
MKTYSGCVVDCGYVFDPTIHEHITAEQFEQEWQSFHVQRQADGRFRFWGIIPEFGNKYLRVVTLDDQQTILNAFFDRNFKETP